MPRLAAPRGLSGLNADNALTALSGLFSVRSPRAVKRAGRVGEHPVLPALTERKVSAMTDLPAPAEPASSDGYQPGLMLVARCAECQATHTASGAGVTALTGIFTRECEEAGHHVTVQWAPLASQVPS
jgi:hypothetical protein